MIKNKGHKKLSNNTIMRDFKVLISGERYTIIL